MSVSNDPKDSNRPPKMLGLEVARGLAAYNVFWVHIVLAIFKSSWVRKARTFSLVHPMSAVKLFLVISGYVLTTSYFATGQKRIIMSRLVKRYPRLLGMIAFGTAFGGLMGNWRRYYIDSQSRSYSNVSTGSTDQNASNLPVIADITHTVQMIFVTTFKGYNDLNEVFWVMRYELIGAYLVLLLAPFVRLIGERSRCGAVLCVALANFAVSQQTYVPAMRLKHPEYTVQCKEGDGVEILDYKWHECYLLGMLLAYFHSRNSSRCLDKTWLNAVCLGAGLIGLCTTLCGRCAFLTAFDHAVGRSQQFGSLLVIHALRSFPDHKSAKRFALVIGDISYPLYACHWPIVRHIGGVILSHYPRSNSPLLLIVAFLHLLVATATVLTTVVDKLWLRLVNGVYSIIENICFSTFDFIIKIIVNPVPFRLFRML